MHHRFQQVTKKISGGILTLISEHDFDAITGGSLSFMFRNTLITKYQNASDKINNRG